MAAPKPGLWERLKSAAAPLVADPLIDRYVTAEGAPRIWAWRQSWRQKVRPAVGLAEPATLLSGTWLGETGLDRALSLAGRVDRFQFRSPARLEMELRDRYVADRQWHAVLELRDYAWTLTEVRLKRTGS